MNDSPNRDAGLVATRRGRHTQHGGRASGTAHAPDLPEGPLAARPRAVRGAACASAGGTRGPRPLWCSPQRGLRVQESAGC